MTDTDLTFARLRAANLARCSRWHPGFPNDGWTGSDWSNAAAGEMGEACNVVKKLRRLDHGRPGAADPDADVLTSMLADEITDTAIYLDLLAAPRLRHCHTPRRHRRRRRHGTHRRHGEQRRHVRSDLPGAPQRVPGPPSPVGPDHRPPPPRRMRLHDDGDLMALDDALDEEESKISTAARWQRKAEERQREIRRLTGRIDELTGLVSNISQVKPDDMIVPKWLRPPKKDGVHHGTPVLMLSDLHLDERVDVFEMDRLNKYDRDIAHARLERVGNSTVKLLHDYIAGLTLDGIVVPLNGDIITGVIHDELARTNEAPVPATISHWVPHLASLLRHLADEFGNVFVPTTDGNHDRTYAKISAKQRSQSSNAWIIYNWLADTLRDDPRITFSISTSPHARWDVYGTRFLQTHGDAFRSSGGVGGLYPSMLKYLLRMHSLYSTARDDFDYCLLGHWHQLLWGPDFIVNGSLKGYDEYARHNGFGFERPAQALFVVTPENGITNRIDVLADDPVDEGWGRKRSTRKAAK